MNQNKINYQFILKRELLFDSSVQIIYSKIRLGTAHFISERRLLYLYNFLIMIFPVSIRVIIL
jgi:hypothetical protein